MNRSPGHRSSRMVAALVALGSIATCIAIIVYVRRGGSDTGTERSAEVRAMANEFPRKAYPSLFVGEIHYQRRNFVGRYDPASLPDTRRAWTGVLSAAIEHVNRKAELMESDPKKYASASWLLGKLLLTAGRIEEAIQTMSRCLELVEQNPSFASPVVRDRMLASLAVAYLRLGEARICIERYNPDGCALPLRESSLHRDPAAAAKAVRLFSQFLAARPEDYEVRWLLNIAYMALGRYPQDVPPRFLIPPEVFESPLDVGKFPNVARAVGVAGFDAAGGAIMDDFDGDGYLDVFTTTMTHEDHARLYRNRGDGTFRDDSEEAGLSQQTGGLNVVHADYDNDGDLDVYILRGGWYYPEPNSLLRNRGNGVFEDVTSQAGLHVRPVASQTATWTDLDGDGDLDLYVGAESRRERPASNQLFVNNGDGTFSEEAKARGVTNDRFCKGVTSGDVDNDGDVDLYVSNYGAENRLYLNNGAGHFTEAGGQFGLAGDAETFATWFWDFDNDGWLDIFVAGYHVDMEDSVRSYLDLSHGGSPIRLYKNVEGKRFINVAEQLGLTRAYLSMGVNFGDIDNDGFLDFMLGTGEPSLHALVPNVMLKNIDGRRFVDVTSSGRFGSLHKGHGIAFGDVDHDGDQDIYAQLGGMMGSDRFYNALYENPGHGHGWITLELVGGISNRNAIGARIDLWAIDRAGRSRRIHRMLSSGGSFGGNTFRLEIGLGDARRIEQLEVWWPTSGTRQRFADVPMGRMFQIREGQDRLVELDYRPFKLGDRELARGTQQLSPFRSSER